MQPYKSKTSFKGKKVYHGTFQYKKYYLNGVIKAFRERKYLSDLFLPRYSKKTGQSTALSS